MIFKKKKKKQTTCFESIYREKSGQQPLITHYQLLRLIGLKCLQTQAFYSEYTHGLNNSISAQKKTH